MNTQYEKIVEQFEDVASLDMIDELMEALQQRRDEIVDENNYREEVENKIAKMKNKMNDIFKDSQDKMREVGKEIKDYCLSEFEPSINSYSNFYLGIKYSDLLRAIIGNIKDVACSSIERYYNYVVQMEQRAGKRVEYFVINLNTKEDDPKDIYHIDGDNDIIIKRDIDKDIYIPY